MTKRETELVYYKILAKTYKDEVESLKNLYYSFYDNVYNMIIEEKLEYIYNDNKRFSIHNFLKQINWSKEKIRVTEFGEIESYIKYKSLYAPTNYYIISPSGPLHIKIQWEIGIKQ